MHKSLLTLVALLGFTTSALADYTMIVPQKPGGGTSQWAQIVATEMEKYLDGEKIILKHIKGARDIPGFNKWHNEYRFCLLYTSPSPRDLSTSRMPSSA